MNITSLLDKMSSNDKDFRYMATNDLMGELKKDSFSLNADMEQKMVNAVLKLLEDKNGEVQNLVVKCLPLMVSKIQENQLEEVVNRLCQHLSSGKDELRDISSIGLKSVIIEIPVTSSVVSSLCKKLTPKLLSSIKKDGASFEVKMDSLDLLTELLSRFGSLMVPYHESILESLLQGLVSTRPAVRKRTATAIGHLVKNLADKHFSSLITHILGNLNSSNPEMLRSYMSCLSTISRFAGKRLSKFLKELSPLLISYIGKNDDELRESCLQILEFLILQCQSEVADLISPAMEKSLELLKYDPNYVDDEEDEDEEMEAEGEEEEEDDGEYSDDDDISWKVRRAASKTLAAIILTRPEKLNELLKVVAPVLITRFSEREENVRVENFSTFIVLLKRISTGSKRSRSDAMEVSDGALSLLKELVPKIAKIIAKTLKDKSQKTKQICFTTLKELVLVLNGGLDNQISLIVPGIQATLKDSSSNSTLKIEVLSFIGCLFKYHSSSSFAPSLSALVPLLLKSTTEKYYKITSEALLTCVELIQAVRPLSTPLQSLSKEFVPLMTQIYNSTLSILAVQDVDQEVKEKAILCIGYVIALSGDALSTELPKCLPILQEKLCNEITRLITTKTLTFIAKSPLNIDLSSILPNVINELSTFLRKTNRSLKLSSLTCLNTLVTSRGKDIQKSQMEGIISEIKALVNDSDLQILPLALALLTSILKVNQSTLSTLQTECFPPIFQLIKSPLLQGSSLKNLMELFGTIVSIDGKQFDNLLKLLLEPVYSSDELSLSSSKQPFFSIAQSIAVISQHSQQNTGSTVQKFIDTIQKSTQDKEKYLGLLILGEIGKMGDIGTGNNVYDVILSMFSDASEEVKSAAAFALGNLAVGNLKKYMPIVLAEIKKQPKKQYLLLHSLKEIISQESQKDAAKNLVPFSEEIWTILFNNCESEEEGTRSAVAECLGKLTMIDPPKYLPALQQQLKSSSAFTRATVIIAIKFTFTTPFQEYDQLFKSIIESFMPLANDSDLLVRRASLQALNSAVHNKPAPIRELISFIEPILYDSTVIQKELIKIVQMGPFKHEVDDGLPIRKAAYECMLSLLQSCPELIRVFDFMDRLIAGLQDKFDIKILCHLILSTLALQFPSQVLQKMEDFVGCLETTINTKVKDNAVKQEIEKNDELIRSSLRAVVSLSMIRDAESNQRFSNFFRLLKTSEFGPKLESIISEADSKDIDSMDTS